MILTDSYVIQLAAALLLGTGLYVSLYVLPERLVFGFLLLIIPFQFVDSRYGSINVVLAYLIFIAFLAQKKITHLPLLLPVMFLFIAYLVAFGHSAPDQWFDHGIYLFKFLSNFALFYLVYNFARRIDDWGYFRDILVWMNILVVIYCFLQLFSGYAGFTFFGIEEFSMHQNREDDRLVGPFSATAVMVEYLSIQSVLLALLTMYETHFQRRTLYVALILFNLMFLVASGNRGGFVTVIMGALVFLYAFRRELGPKKIAISLVTGTVLMVLASVIIIKYTQFDTLYERLGQTHVQDGMPDTRADTWPKTWAKIKASPWFGYGPKFYAGEESELQLITYPHSLYLFVPVTLGLLGLVAYTVFFANLSFRFYRARWSGNADAIAKAIPKISLIILIVFFLSEARIEMLRDKLNDYQNYLFTLLGILLAFSDSLAQKRKEAAVNNDAPAAEVIGVASNTLSPQVLKLKQ